MHRPVIELARLRACTGSRQVHALAKEHGQKVGNGSGRTVFGLTDEMVIKVARNYKGVAQNRLEADPRFRAYSDVTAQVVAADPAGLWVMQQRAAPLSTADWEAGTGVRLSTFRLHLLGIVSRAPLTHPLLLRVTELRALLELDAYDLAEIDSYGRCNGRILLTDYGLSIGVARSLYGVPY